jgi:hypothetical protein
MTENEIYSK